jgi:hypothetical protein
VSAPAVAADSAGNVIAVWSKSNLIQAAHYTANSGTWSSPTDVAVSRFARPVIAVNATGNASSPGPTFHLQEVI